jgi:Domain of unknown function (DUF222)
VTDTPSCQAVLMELAVFERGLKDFRQQLVDFEPALITTGDAVRAFAVFSSIEKTVVAAKTLVASRAACSDHWQKEGHRSPAHWVAETTGSGIGESHGLIENSGRLVELPETTEALRRGELSGAQLREMAATAAAHPRAESELLEAAKRHGLRGLRDQCRRVKARSMSETDARARYEEIRKNRSLQMWTDQDGVGRIDGRLAPDDFARFCGAIKAKSDLIFGEARKAGHRESGAAYAADALVALVTGGQVGRTGRPTTMHLRVDLAALRRGSLEEGEVCELPGVGRVPLATARHFLGDALLKVIVTDGVDVTSVCHVGRAVPAHIRSALEDRDEKCVVPGCDVAQGLEIDHYRIAFENDGPTELWNLCRLCRWHHHLKTYRGFVLSGQPGSWRWEAPATAENPVLTE